MKRLIKHILALSVFSAASMPSAYAWKMPCLYGSPAAQKLEMKIIELGKKTAAGKDGSNSVYQIVQDVTDSEALQDVTVWASYSGGCPLVSEPVMIVARNACVERKLSLEYESALAAIKNTKFNGNLPNHLKRVQMQVAVSFINGGVHKVQ